MNTKMIVTDLDGTLLRSDKTISEHTASVLRRCQQDGIKVVFATARSEKSAERFITKVRPDVIISNGGALACDDRNTLYRCILPHGTTSSFISDCLQVTEIGYITVESDDGYFVNYPINPDEPGWLDYGHAVYTNFTKGFECDVYKITLELSDAARLKDLTASYPIIDILGFAGENWYRFAHRKATKWNAIKAVAEHFNIDTNDIVAFGDDYNDAEMLQNCGVGVAMANAIDEVKAAAHHITASNDDDGVARWLEENVLI